MKKRHWAWVFCAFLPALLIWGNLYGLSELCHKIHMKPVLSLQQVRNADLVHLLLEISGQKPPSPEGKPPEEMYKAEVKMLLDAGYPPLIAEMEPDRLVTRRYFAAVLFQLAVVNHPESHWNTQSG